jgi:hypothetical protein
MAQLVQIEAIRLSTTNWKEGEENDHSEESAVHVLASIGSRTRQDTQTAEDLKALAKEGRLGYEPLPLSASAPFDWKKASEWTDEQYAAEFHPTGFIPLEGKFKKNTLQVPRDANDLTPPFCTDAFRTRGLLSETESVTAVQLTPLGAGEGEASDNYLMSLEVDGAAPKLARKLVAKFTSPKMNSLEKAYNFSPEAHFCEAVLLELGCPHG